jgi:tRNA nucleotidyltransferase (CCA-adding enzyme)
MKKYLDSLSAEIKNFIAKASRIADRHNMTAYLVGGLVRDLFLGVKNLDLDIVVEGDGIRFAEDIAGTLGARLIAHRRFGTATLFINPDFKVDIATTRRETYPQPASLPVVERGSLRDDLSRRDFSINAMAISINGKNPGELVDFFGGASDISLKKIRVLHRRSFIDDPTRILRAVRFEQRYGFKIETDTLKCLKKAKSLGMLAKVQPHRLRDELILFLKERHPLSGVKRLNNLAGFTFISPRLSVSKKTYTLFSSIEKEISWFQKNFPANRVLDTWLIYLAALLEDISSASIRSICKDFAFRKGEVKRILSYKKVARRIAGELGRQKIEPSGVFSLLEPLSYEVIILLRAKYKNANLRKHIFRFLRVYNGMRITIGGDDLCGLGIKPGPHYQKIFRKVLRAKLNGSISSQEEELGMIKKITRL